jgi:23S rRNA (cytidine1920-2'-O)/16S rRNA (cytidine1409-2'-O)-methyltransferase
VAKPGSRRRVSLVEALATRFPHLDDPTGAVATGRVRVDGKPALNPRGLVAATAAITVDPVPLLRGATKLAAALDTFDVSVTGRLALDAGAAAGGFTTVLLDRGAVRVYAVDAGHGQLRGSLRQDARVVNLERTNLGELTPTLVPDVIDVVTLDLSYLSIAAAVPALDRVQLAGGADLVALVKPMFELGLDRPPDDVARFEAASAAARRGIAQAGWHVVADMESPARGARGAVEFFLHARR